jgi:hypothetical protein
MLHCTYTIHVRENKLVLAVQGRDQLVVMRWEEDVGM